LEKQQDAIITQLQKNGAIATWLWRGKVIESEGRHSANTEFAHSIKQIWKTLSGLEGKSAAWVKEELLVHWELP
jgi:hypothetical protein